MWTLCEIQATYHPKKTGCDRPRINSGKDVFDLRHEIFKDGLEYREQVFVIPLSASKKILGVCKICDGGLTEALVDVRIIFQHLLLANAVSFVMVHNHPSGSVYPSTADNKLTMQVNEAANIMKISLIDHLVISEDQYYSYFEEGRL